MVRRLSLTCMVLSFNALSSQTIFVLSIGIVTLAFERECRPYINPYLSSFCYLLHWQIVMVSLYVGRGGGFWSLTPPLIHPPTHPSILGISSCSMRP